jgi:hypothetical protein
MAAMKQDQVLRLMGGSFALLGLILGHTVHEGWYFFTVFVCLNQIQSAFTNWCPAMWILDKLGVEK